MQAYVPLKTTEYDIEYIIEYIILSNISNA